MLTNNCLQREPPRTQRVRLAYNSCTATTCAVHDMDSKVSKRGTEKHREEARRNPRSLLHVARAFVPPYRRRPHHRCRRVMRRGTRGQIRCPVPVACHRHRVHPTKTSCETSPRVKLHHSSAQNVRSGSAQHGGILSVSVHRARPAITMRFTRSQQHALYASSTAYMGKHRTPRWYVRACV